MSKGFIYFQMIIYNGLKHYIHVNFIWEQAFHKFGRSNNDSNFIKERRVVREWNFLRQNIIFPKTCFWEKYATLHKPIENFPLQTESGKVNSIPERKLQTGWRTGWLYKN